MNAFEVPLWVPAAAREEYDLQRRAWELAGLRICPTWAIPCEWCWSISVMSASATSVFFGTLLQRSKGGCEHVPYVFMMTPENLPPRWPENLKLRWD